MRSSRAFLCGLVLAGCGSGRREAPPPVVTPVIPVHPLAYAPPVVPAGVATYEFTDTLVSDIQGGAIGTIRVSIGVRGLADLRFEPAGTDLKVTVTFKEFAGSFTNSAGGGTVTATAADITGPLVANVTPRGLVTVTQQPQLSPAFRAVTGSEQTHRRFFVRLPGRAVPLGGVWTDTVVTEETNEGLTSRVRNIVRATYARDTTVAGTRMMVIVTTTERTLDITGSSQGVEIVQKLKGTANGTSLWDPARNLVFSRNESATMIGTFDLPAMNMSNMPITASGQVRVRLRDG
jgi:hypothetical protein